jgi:hypothetical protein
VSKANGLYKSVEIFNNQTGIQLEMSDEIQSLFHGYFKATSKYELCKAFAVHNNGLFRQFETKKANMERRIQDPAFSKKAYQGESEWREWIADVLHAQSSKFPHNSKSEVKVLPVLQGLKKPEVAWNICQTGTATLSQLDDGYYGSGELPLVSSLN